MVVEVGTDARKVVEVARKVVEVVVEASMQAQGGAKGLLVVEVQAQDARVVQVLGTFPSPSAKHQIFRYLE